MDMMQNSQSDSLGQVLMNARLRRGITQEELGKDSGIGQAAVAKIERNRTVPKVTTLCRYLRALSLTPEEEVDVWQQLRGQISPIDWVERLGIDSYGAARARAQARLNSGDSYDAYGYIEVMLQLAADKNERAYAELLHANRFKDLGLHNLAEQYYNRATVTLGSDGSPATMTRILVNLADLHVELGRLTLADAYITYALAREGNGASFAYGHLVKGRVRAAQSSPEAHAEALSWYERAAELYARHDDPLTREPGINWARYYMAELQSRSPDRATRERAIQALRQLASLNGPADRPSNPELYARVTLALAELTGDSMMLNTTQRVARKHGLRGVLNRLGALAGAALLIVATAAPVAEARTSECTQPSERPEVSTHRLGIQRYTESFKSVDSELMMRMVESWMMWVAGSESSDTSNFGEPPEFSDNGSPNE